MATYIQYTALVLGTASNDDKFELFEQICDKHVTADSVIEKLGNKHKHKLLLNYIIICIEN